MTFVAVVASNERLQAVAPQFFIGNRHVLQVKTLRALSAEVPANCHIWREPTSWNNTRLMEKILTLIAEKIVPQMEPHRQLAIIYDCASMHLGRSVLLKARELSLWVVLVPTQCTSAVQVADTHVFFALKTFLRKRIAQVKMQSEHGAITRENWLRCCLQLEGFLTSRSWRHAFMDNGILGARDRLSAKLREHHFSPPSLMPAPPSYEQLCAILPKASQVHYWDLFGDIIQEPPLLS